MRRDVSKKIVKPTVAKRILKELTEKGDVVISRQEAIEITIAFFKRVGIEKTIEECIQIVDSIPDKEE